jgi:DNA-binding winged helix-turn-helix (wHTH) protein
MLVFGPFTVDAARKTVMKNGVPLRLTLRCIELLLAFVRNSGKILTKQELVDLAWPDPEASDATLAQHVFLLRKALRHERCHWIRTIPNVGYSFTGDVRTIETGDDERLRAWRSYVDAAERLRAIGSERALRSAIDLCTHAVALDESRERAYALRASCWRLLAESMYAEPMACLQAAQADIEAALARNSADAEVRIEAAYAAASLHRHFARAQQHLDAAQRLYPGHPELLHARVRCALMDARCDEALRLARGVGGALYGWVLYMARDYGRAREIFDRFAGDDAASRVVRGACLLFAGDLSGALGDFHAAYYADATAKDGGVPSVRQCALALYVYTLAKNGEPDAARRHLQRLEALGRKRYVSPMAFAVAYLGLGEADRAIACVEDALRRYDAWAAYVLVDPILDELRTYEKFRDMARNAA